MNTIDMIPFGADIWLSKEYSGKLMLLLNVELLCYSLPARVRVQCHVKQAIRERTGERVEQLSHYQFGNRIVRRIDWTNHRLVDVVLPNTAVAPNLTPDWLFDRLTLFQTVYVVGDETRRSDFCVANPKNVISFSATNFSTRLQ